MFDHLLYSWFLKHSVDLHRLHVAESVQTDYNPYEPEQRLYKIEHIFAIVFNNLNN